PAPSRRITDEPQALARIALKRPNQRPPLGPLAAFEPIDSDARFAHRAPVHPTTVMSERAMPNSAQQMTKSHAIKFGRIGPSATQSLSGRRRGRRVLKLPQ